MRFVTLRVRAAGALLTAAAGVVVAPPGAYAGELHKVSLTGDAPGGLENVARFSKFGVPAINSSGAVVFSATVSPIPSALEPSYPYNSGVWRGTPEATSLIAWSDSPHPDTSLRQLTAFRDAIINHAGHVAYVADAATFYGPGGVGGAGEVGTVWSTRSGSPQLVFRKDDLPGRDTSIPRFGVPREFAAVRMDAAGRIALGATAEESSPNHSAQGVWHWGRNRRDHSRV